MPALLPRKRTLSATEQSELQALQSAADAAGLVLDNLFVSSTELCRRVEAIESPKARDVLLAQAMDAEECLAEGHKLLREGFIMIEQSIQRRPVGI